MVPVSGILLFWFHTRCPRSWKLPHLYVYVHVNIHIVYVYSIQEAVATAMQLLVIELEVEEDVEELEDVVVVVVVHASDASRTGLRWYKDALVGINGPLIDLCGSEYGLVRPDSPSSHGARPGE